jgi:hypothetical protein
MAINLKENPILTYSNSSVVRLLMEGTMPVRRLLSRQLQQMKSDQFKFPNQYFLNEKKKRRKENIVLT